MAGDEDLPPERRLALAYVPAAHRPAMDAFLRLDFVLGRAVGQASEPIVGQLRLAWWRDALGADADRLPQGNPLLDDIVTAFGSELDFLVRLVDGWEVVLLAEQLDGQAVEPLLDARSRAWVALGSMIDPDVEAGPILASGRRWALADLLSGLSDALERTRILALASPATEKIILPRSLRSLAILASLSERAITRGGGALLGDRKAALVALRSGLFGR